MDISRINAMRPTTVMSEGTQAAVSRKLDRAYDDVANGMDRWGGNGQSLDSEVRRYSTKGTMYKTKFEHQTRQIGELADALEKRGDKEAGLAVLALLGG